MSGAPSISGPGTADARTLDVYARLSEQYVDMVAMSVTDVSPQLARFMAALPAGPERVLDWGAGVAQASALMASHGVVVESTDASPEMAAHALELGVKVRIEPFEALAPDPPRFRGIWSSVSLCHVPRAMLAAILARGAAALLPGGALAMKMKAGAGEMRDDLGRFFALWEADDLSEACRGAGLEIVIADESDGPSLTGERQRYIDLLARRPAT